MGFFITFDIAPVHAFGVEGHGNISLCIKADHTIGFQVRPIHDGAHGMLPYAEAQVSTLKMGRLKIIFTVNQCFGGRRQVSGATDQTWNFRRDGI